MTAVWITGIVVFGLVGGFVALCYIAAKDVYKRQWGWSP